MFEMVQFHIWWRSVRVSGALHVPCVGFSVVCLEDVDVLGFPFTFVVIVIKKEFKRHRPIATEYGIILRISLWVALSRPLTPVLVLSESITSVFQYTLCPFDLIRVLSRFA